MTTEKIVNGTTVVLKIIGRVSVSTAAALEAAVNDCIADAQELVLDCSALEYVSSAGLRVLLKAQKQMNAKGAMKLINVNETVMEVLDITGFADFLTIE